MASLFGALGSLAESYGLARQNIFNEQQKQAEARLAEERVNLEKEQVAQSKARLVMEESQNRRPLPFGQAYKKDGKWVQPIWDPLKNQGQGGLSEIEEGAVENPLLELQRQVKEAGGYLPTDKAMELLYPKSQTLAGYDIKTVMGINEKGKQSPVYAYFPKDPTKQPIITNKEAYERPPSSLFGEILTPQDENTVDFFADQLAGGNLTEDALDKALVGKGGDKLRGPILRKALTRGYNPQAQLSTAGAKTVSSLGSVLDLTNKLRKHIEDLRLTKNNQRFYLALNRIDYATGKASPVGSLGKDIAGLSLGSVREAAAVLQGSSRAMAALQRALEHTPNAWTDSPALLYDKLNNIADSLDIMIEEAQKYQTKSGIPNLNIAAPGATGGSASATTTPSPQQLTPGQKELMRQIYPPGR